MLTLIIAIFAYFLLKSITTEKTLSKIKPVQKIAIFCILFGLTCISWLFPIAILILFYSKVIITGEEL